MKNEAVAQALEGARVLELTGQVEMRMSRQMGWDGAGEAGDEGDERMGEGGMPLVYAQGWKESCSVIIP